MVVPALREEREEKINVQEEVKTFKRNFMVGGNGNGKKKKGGERLLNY